MIEGVDDRQTMPLYEEYRLIEKAEEEVHGAWRGAHLLLFFLSFVFGFICTFCFQMLMHFFDNKCVLFPKTQLLSNKRHHMINSLIPNKEVMDELPLELVSTDWMDKSSCHIPVYTPMLSGIFGLIWTTIYLMSSSGSPNITGLQRSWRVLPVIFIFSLAQSSVCIYATVLTHRGLNELCQILGAVTGNPSYTINVATLPYEHRIRGVYQGIRMTIITAWLHTSCWILAALLAVLRIILVIDFHLIRVQASLKGDFDKLLEHHEKHVRTVSPDIWIKEDYNEFDARFSSDTFVEVHYRNRTYSDTSVKSQRSLNQQLSDTTIPSSEHMFHIITSDDSRQSSLSLVPEEQDKLMKLNTYKKVPTNKHFIVKMLYDLLETMDLPQKIDRDSSEMPDSISSIGSEKLERRLGQRKIVSGTNIGRRRSHTLLMIDKEAEKLAAAMRRALMDKLPPNNPLHKEMYESSLNLTNEMKKILLARKKAEEKASRKRKIKAKKSILKQKGVQTDQEKRVQIVSEKTMSDETLKPSGEEERDERPDADSGEGPSTTSESSEGRSTQTEKEKQD